MLAEIDKTVVNRFMRIRQIESNTQNKTVLQEQHNKNVSALQSNEGSETKKPIKVEKGRNDPCPCGSGKKFKKCCGA